MLASYLKLAVKVLLRRRFFTFISLFGISVTLAVLMVASALLDHILAPQAPESRANQTLGIYQLTLEGESFVRGGSAGYYFLDRFVRPMENLPGVEAISFFSGTRTAVSYLGGRRIQSVLKRTDGDFWRILDFDFLEGRGFTAADERDRRFVAVINETTRRRFFGGQPAVGRTIEVDDQRFRVVGVVRDVPFLRLVPFADVWVPISTAKSNAYRKEWAGELRAIVLARDRADFPALKAELQARAREAETQLPDRKTYDRLYVALDTPAEMLAREPFNARGPESPVGRLWGVVFAVTVLFMLLPTLNLINLSLSRILERASEIGVRRAFGASSRTLVGQFVVENVVLTLLGAALGLALAAAALAGLNASGLIPYARLGLNVRIFVYGVALALFFGVFSGLYPAWRMSRLHPVEALRGRSS